MYPTKRSVLLLLGFSSRSTPRAKPLSLKIRAPRVFEKGPLQRRPVEGGGLRKTANEVVQKPLYLSLYHFLYTMLPEKRTCEY